MRRLNSKVTPESFPPIRFYEDVHGELQILEGDIIVGIDRGYIIGAVINESLRPVYNAAQNRIIVLMKNNHAFPVDVSLAEDNPVGVRPRQTLRIFLPKLEHHPGR